jgi:hypothetical protein
MFTIALLLGGGPAAATELPERARLYEPPLSSLDRRVTSMRCVVL